MSTPTVSAPYTILDAGAAQGLPNWTLVAAGAKPKVDGVYLKATEGASGSGSSVASFPRNAKAVVAADLPLGCYHFLSPFSDALAQAQHFAAVVEGCGHTLPPMVDVERSAGASGQFPTLATLVAFLAALEDALNVVPLIYTAGWVAGPMKMASRVELKDYPLWVAAYQSHDPSPFPPWGAWGDDGGNVLGWQYTGSGHVQGVGGAVDLSRFKALPSWTRAKTEPPPATLPTGSPAPTVPVDPPDDCE